MSHETTKKNSGCENVGEVRICGWWFRDPGKGDIADKKKAQTTIFCNTDCNFLGTAKSQRNSNSHKIIDGWLACCTVSFYKESELILH